VRGSLERLAVRADRYGVKLPTAIRSANESPLYSATSCIFPAASGIGGSLCLAPAGTTPYLTPGAMPRPSSAVRSHRSEAFSSTIRNWMVHAGVHENVGVEPLDIVTETGPVQGERSLGGPTGSSSLPHPSSKSNPPTIIALLACMNAEDIRMLR